MVTLYTGRILLEEQPLISIITACFNRADFIREAIESVLRQDYERVEHIIIDGGSTDGTLDILRSYPHLKVISEPDRGIYDAWNKGLRLAQGEIIGILNTDDLYEENVFGAVISELAASDELDAVVGGVTYFEAMDSGTRRVIQMNPPIGEGQLWPRVTTGSPVTNAWFIRRKLYDRIGGYDAQYFWAGDREFFLRAAFAGLVYQPLDMTVYHYRRHGGSFTLDPGARQAVRVWNECLSIIERYIIERRDHQEGQYYLRIWHAQLSSEAAILALRQGKLAIAWQFARRGLKLNPAWWGTFFSLGAGKVARLPEKALRKLTDGRQSGG